MTMLYLRMATVILVMGFIHVYQGQAKPLVQLSSENLVWKPYLQQLTDTGVIVLWTTTNGATSIVRYSTDTTYDSVTSGTSRPLSDLGTQLHRVALTGLQPNTTYHYKIYADGEDLLPQETLTFTTAPQTGDSTPFTFLAFGDYGKGSSSQERLRDQMQLDSFDFILTTGDNAYPDGTYDDYDQYVFTTYGDIFKRAALFPTWGNHDYHTDEAAPSLDLFDLPTNAWRAADAERYYSFDYGNVHFVALDTNTPLYDSDSAASDDMFDWLRADLSQTNQLWKIVAFHNSAYSTGKHGSGSRVQSRLVPILEEYGVDLVLTGHDHIYQRSKSLREGQETSPAEGGIVYVVSGAGHEAGYDCEPASWSVIAYCSQDYGIYARITVAGGRLTLEAIDEAGALKDYFVLEKETLCVEPGMDEPIEEVRQLDVNDAGLFNPAGLAYIFGANLFYVLTTETTSPTLITTITPFVELFGSDQIETAGVDPINIAFDNLGQRLLVLDSVANDLISIDTEPDGSLDTAPTAVERYPIGALALQQPGGLTLDPNTGALFILDSQAMEIVRVEPDAQGGFAAPAALAEGRVSHLELGPLGLTQGRGLAFNPANKQLYLLDPLGKNLYELTATGQLITTLDLASFELVDPHGLVFGASTDLTDDPGQINLYVADTGLVPGLTPGPNFWIYLPLLLKSDPANDDLVRPSFGGTVVPLGRIVEFSLTPVCP